MMAATAQPLQRVDDKRALRPSSELATLTGRVPWLSFWNPEFKARLRSDV
jgi:hypothetical protein